MSTPGGQWVPVDDPGYPGRMDWVPTEQPASPDGTVGEWHVVGAAAGVQGSWEWHQAQPRPSSAAPLSPPVWQQPSYGTGYGQQTSYGAVSVEQKRRTLANAIQQRVLNGARVESQTDDTAVLVTGHRPNHMLHLVLSIVTLGFWAFVWVAVYIIAKERRSMIRVDDYGNVLYSE